LRRRRPVGESGARISALKEEWIKRHRYTSRDEARLSIFRYIETFFAGAEARHVQPAVVDGEVDVGHERRDGAEGLQCGW
jgi:hypothetical protein